MRSLLLPLALVSSVSSAQPRPELLQWIDGTYDPKVRATNLDGGYSLLGCWTEDFRVTGKDPITGNDRHIDVTIYHAHADDEAAPTVLILPPTGGVNILDKGYANALCNDGVRAVLIRGWDHQLETDLDMKMHDRGAVRSLAAIRHVIEFLNPQNPKQLGILGTSIGALASTMALGYDSRIQAGALIVGSGRFADVIADSTETGAAKLRQARMKAHGYEDIEKYRAALKASLLTEPSEFVNFSGAKKSLVITASQDLTVRTEYQLELAELLQPQKHIHLPGDHLMVIKQSFFQHCSTIVKFFKENLN